MTHSANVSALTPVSFLERAAEVYPDKIAVIHGDHWTYAQMAARVRRFASALVDKGMKTGDVVSVLAPNCPALLEAHYAVPLAGGVLNAINTRLDAATISFILDHAKTKIVLVDREYADVARKALAMAAAEPVVIDIDDPLTEAQGGTKADPIGDIDYDAMLAGGEPNHPWSRPHDEMTHICLNYTSGTTGNPKGVLYSHRGAFLNALANLTAMNVSLEDSYLWTLPMFHCNGWTFTWAVTAAAATHICLRRVEPALIFDLIAKYKATKLCAAPIVLNALANAPETQRKAFSHSIEAATGGAAPPRSVIEAMEAMGFSIQHAYGLTETYGPATYCTLQPGWQDLSLDDRSALMARQGVRHAMLDAVEIMDPQKGDLLPADGKSLGEIVIRGNTVMSGYHKNPTATQAALKDGWFHSGDLGVKHSDNYIEIKDRSKDIIISGGENISSLEVEEAIYRHPAVLEVAVVAKPDEKWGETPCAFITIKPGNAISQSEIEAHCRAHLAGYKVPRYVIFRDLPKTSTGKIEKFKLRDIACRSTEVEVP